MDEKQFNLNEKQFLDYFSEQFPNIIVSEDTVHGYFINSRKKDNGHFYDFVLNNGLIEEIIIDDQPEEEINYKDTKSKLRLRSSAKQHKDEDKTSIDSSEKP